jgi:hypothetical protein
MTRAFKLWAIVAGCSLAGNLLLAQDVTTVGAPTGEHAFETVLRGDQNGNSGQVYGYLVHIWGIDDSRLFTAPQSGTAPPRGEANARFTISGTLDVTSRFVLGNIITSVSEGTLTIYYNESPSGNFDQPGTFSSGTPIATFQAHTQTVLNVQRPLSAEAPGKGIFQSSNDLLQQSATEFTLDGGEYALGLEGTRFRYSLVGDGTLTAVNPFIATFLLGGLAEVSAQPVLPPSRR